MVSLPTQFHALLMLTLPALSHDDSSLQCQLYWTLGHPGNMLVGVSMRVLSDQSNQKEEDCYECRCHME